MKSRYDELKDKQILEIQKAPTSVVAIAWDGNSPDRQLVWDAFEKKIFINYKRRVWTKADLSIISLGDLDILGHHTRIPKPGSTVSVETLQHIREEARIAAEYGQDTIYNLSAFMHTLNTNISRYSKFDFKELVHTRPELARLLDKENGGIAKEHKDLLILDTIKALHVIQQANIRELNTPDL